MLETVVVCAFSCLDENKKIKKKRTVDLFILFILYGNYMNRTSKQSNHFLLYHYMQVFCCKHQPLFYR